MAGQTGGHEAGQDVPPDLVAGRYELTRRLGRGGMGEVFSALDRSTGKTVALKRLHAAALAQRPQQVHFMQEYHALAALRHPRIIEVYEFGVDGVAPYYTMELLDGQDLRDLSPLPYREACSYLRDVASSLALLHARRLLHRDVTPRNVRRTSDGHCKLLDFGAMIAFGVPPNVTGTAPCIAPEAMQGANLDQRSDLYSLGALAYSVLTGKHAYAASQIDELPEVWARAVKRPKRLVPLPDELDELVMTLLSLDPMKRPKSAAEVIDRLSAIAQLPPDDAPGVARSFLTSAQLCGREHESEQIARHAQQAALGHGSTLILEGNLGTGKSRMFAESALIAQTCGLSVVRAVAGKQRRAGDLLARELISALQQVLPAETRAAAVSSIEWPGTRSNALYDTESSDPTEQRARLQQALTDALRAITRTRPVLLAVDDFDRSDEFSSAWIASLALQAAGLPLLIVLTRTSGRAMKLFAVNALRGHATRIRLGDLMRGQSVELVHSMFGSVPNIQLLQDWLFRVARGNPKLTTELADSLFQRDLVRYVDGTWLLPTEPITLEVPSDLNAAWALRIGALSRPAVALAELLALRRGGATTERCVAAMGGKPDAIFAALDELVRAGVLESAGLSYVFAQESVRTVLEQRTSLERQRELHARWAEVLLADGHADHETTLEAGWHLVHTQQELRGAALLAQVAPLLVDQGLHMAAALPAIEKALEVYERLGGPLAVRLKLRSTLVISGYNFDYRLALRYGDETVALLHRLTGLALAQRLSRYLGASIALAIGVVVAFVGSWWRPRLQRGPGPYTAIRYFVRSAVGLLGMRTTSLDGPAVSTLYAKLAPLAGAPRWSVGPAIVLACRALSRQLSGRETEIIALTQRAVRALQRPWGQRGASVVQLRNLTIGLLTSEGVTEGYREGSKALALADRLERMGTRASAGGALRVRMLYYAQRGDSDRAEQCRQQIDLHAIQGGTVWQGEWFSVPLEGLAASLWGDLVALRRSLDRLGRLSEEMPALATMRDTLQIGYCGLRGEYQRGAELGEALLAAHPPSSFPGWSATYGMIAHCWIELGQAQRARALCESSLALVSAEDRAFFTMYTALESGLALSLAALGELPAATALLRARIERLRAQDEHAYVVLVLRTMILMYRHAKDRAGLDEASREIRTAALQCGLPTVISFADRVIEHRGRHSSPMPPGPDELVPESFSELPDLPLSALPDVTIATAFLQGKPSGQKRSTAALRFLANAVASDEIYLYRDCEQGLQLMASIPDAASASGLAEALREHLLRLGAAAEHEPLAIVVSDEGSEGPFSEQKRFRVLPLTAAENATLSLGVLALREGTETLREIAPELLAELGRVLMDDLRAEEDAQVQVTLR